MSSIFNFKQTFYIIRIFKFRIFMENLSILRKMTSSLFRKFIDRYISKHLLFICKFISMNFFLLFFFTATISTWMAWATTTAATTISNKISFRFCILKWRTLNLFYYFRLSILIFFVIVVMRISAKSSFRSP